MCEHSLTLSNSLIQGLLHSVWFVKHKKLSIKINVLPSAWKHGFQ